MIINLEKRHAYFIIGLLVLAVGIFVVNALTPGIAPNPGNTIETISPPTGCGEGQVLQFIDEVSGWGCVDDTDDQTLSIAGQTLSISEGNSVSLPSGGGIPWIQYGVCKRGRGSYVDFFVACEYRVCTSAGCSAWYTGNRRMVVPYVASGYWS